MRILIISQHGLGLVTVNAQCELTSLAEFVWLCLYTAILVAYYMDITLTMSEDFCKKRGALEAQT